jgi:hypothetical protein
VGQSRAVGVAFAAAIEAHVGWVAAAGEWAVAERAAGVFEVRSVRWSPLSPSAVSYVAPIEESSRDPDRVVQVAIHANDHGVVVGLTLTAETLASRAYLPHPGLRPTVAWAVVHAAMALVRRRAAVCF